MLRLAARERRLGLRAWRRARACVETARKEDDELTQAVGLSSSAAEREEARCRGAALVSSLQPGLAWIEERQAGPHGWVSYTRPCRSAGPARGCDALAASREGEMEQYQRGQRVPQLCLPVPSLETGRFFWMTPKPAALVRLVAQLMAPKPAALQPAALLPLVALPSRLVCAFSCDSTHQPGS